MPAKFTKTLDTPTFKGTVSVETGLFIGGKWVEPVDSATVSVVNPVSGDVTVTVAAGSSKDVDLAVEAAKRAYDTVWGPRASGEFRGKLLNNLADLMEKHAEELAALEVLDVGKPYSKVTRGEIPFSISTIRYYAGWADKVQGKTIESNEDRFAYSRHEPYGVVGQIIPWNFPLMMFIMKIGPALATGNTIVIKPSEITPLSALRMADLIAAAGFPPGVVNVVNGEGPTVGSAISRHPIISKISFTGSTLVGRKILAASAESNLKNVSLELGGKSPAIVFDDADLEQAVKWVGHGIYSSTGQSCIAGSRIFIQEKIYDEFLKRFSDLSVAIQNSAGDPFESNTRYGPLVSQIQLDRVMSYIESGKREGATLLLGGQQYGDRGFFVQPTVFTDVTPEMKIVREEIFGPVSAIVKFTTEEEVIRAANDTCYGLGCSVFTENGKRATRVTHAIEAGSAWVNFAQMTHPAVPFGGYKQSGIGRELGEYALETYTQVKAVHVNLGFML